MSMGTCDGAGAARSGYSYASNDYELIDNAITWLIA